MSAVSSEPNRGQLPLVAVTGGAGRLGRGVVALLREAGFPVRNIDRVENPQAHENRTGDLADPTFALEATRGVCALVHLAATPDDDDFIRNIVPNNICAVYHLLEACRLHGIRTVVLAGTGQVNWWQNQTGPWPIRVTDPVTPKAWYAASKLFVEGAAYGFHQVTGADVVVGRLGWCPRTQAHAEELAASVKDRNLYLSAGDFGRFVRAVLQTKPGFGHVLTFVTSRTIDRVLFDQADAERLFGYQPVDQWPEGMWDYCP